MIRDVLTLSRLRAMPADEAAALWTVRLAEGGFPHERELFEEWLDRAPGNRSAWERAQISWKMFDDAEDDELLEEMRRHARSAKPSSAYDWRRYAAAAALFVVVAGGSIVADRSGIIGGGNRGTETGPAGTPPITQASYVYVSGRELPKLITLPDGSRMTLDAQSKVTAAFRGNHRTVHVVTGRAFFDVHHDASRPFVLSAGNLKAVDIGTRFEVQVAPQLVHVALVEGRLAISAPKIRAPLLLSPGDEVRARDGGTPVLTRSPAAPALDWQKGFASFDNDTLTEAAAVLNRYPGDEIIVRSPGVAGLRISGNFRIGDAERFGRTLEQIYPVRTVRRNEHQIELVPAG